MLVNDNVVTVAVFTAADTGAISSAQAAYHFIGILIITDGDIGAVAAFTAANASAAALSGSRIYITARDLDVGSVSAKLTAADTGAVTTAIGCHVTSGNMNIGSVLTVAATNAGSVASSGGGYLAAGNGDLTGSRRRYRRRLRRPVR